MTNGVSLLVENKNPFSPISVVHYEYYKDEKDLKEKYSGEEDIQCMVGAGFVPFGQAQNPSLFSYADGVDTMEFLLSL